MTPHGNSTNALQLTRSSACRRVGCCSCPARSGAAGYTDDGGIRRCDRSTCRSVCGSGRVHRMPNSWQTRRPDVREQSPVAREVSEPGSYGFLDLITTEDRSGIRGGVSTRCLVPDALDSALWLARCARIILLAGMVPGHASAVTGRGPGAVDRPGRGPCGQLVVVSSASHAGAPQLRDVDDD